MQNVSGFFDLCVNDSAIVGNYDATIKDLYNHGYRTIAINYIIDEVEHQDIMKSQSKKKRKGDQDRQEVEKSIFPKLISIKPVQGCESMMVLQRITIYLATKDFYAKIVKMSEYRRYHLVAILPLNLAMLGVTCSDIEADILTLRSDQKSEYKVLRKHYSQLIASGYHVELMYAPAISNESSRRYVISSAHDLHVVGKSKNIIISSGITDITQIRSPYDIINLGLIFGLNQAQSKMAVMQNCRNTYYHGVSRRYGKVAMIATNITSSENMQTEEIANDDDNDVEVEISDVGHQLKKIKT